MTRCPNRFPLFAAGLLALAAGGLPGCGESHSSVKTGRGVEASRQEPVDPSVVAAVDHLYDDVKNSAAQSYRKKGNSAVPSGKQTSSAKLTSAGSGTSKAADQFPGEPLAMLSDRDAVKIVGPKANTLNPALLGPRNAKAPPRKIEILVKDRKFLPDRPEGPLRVLYEDLDLLRVINMDPVTEDCQKYMPAWLKDLNGKKVRIRGYMAAGFLETGITNFVMARDTQACCFGPNTKIYHLIEVGMQPGSTAEYMPMRPLEVEGTFRIEAGVLDGQMFHLYFIDNAEIVAKK